MNELILCDLVMLIMSFLLCAIAFVVVATWMDKDNFN